MSTIGENVPRNPFDFLELARDMVRQDEAQAIFDAVSDWAKKWQAMEHDPEEDGGGYLAGLDWVMDLLDGRIGYHRDRWG